MINGGQASNLCTHIANGDVALSVMMTTVTTIGAIFMTPLLAKVLLYKYIMLTIYIYAYTCIHTYMYMCSPRCCSALYIHHVNYTHTHTHTHTPRCCSALSCPSTRRASRSRPSRWLCMYMYTIL